MIYKTCKFISSYSPLYVPWDPNVIAYSCRSKAKEQDHIAQVGFMWDNSFRPYQNAVLMHPKDEKPMQAPSKKMK